MQSKITETDKSIKSLESQWQELQLEFERSELLLEKANEEIANLAAINGDGSSSGTRVSLKETLAQQIFEQETVGKRLAEEKTALQGSKMERQRQQEMWGDLKRLFEVKIRCFHENKQRGPGGTLSVSRGGAETFILQWVAIDDEA